MAAHRTIYLIHDGCSDRVALDEIQARRIVAGLRGSRWIDADRIRVTRIDGTCTYVTADFAAKEK